jgi:leader peptidase (prepilin peptidase)/N-methyltransferase
MRVAEAAVICMTVINSIQDIRKKEILLIPTVLAGAAGAVWTALNGRPAGSMLLGFVPGALVLVLSILSKGRVGSGDAVVIMALGTWLGIAAAAGILLTALLAAAAAGAVYMAKGGRKKEMPFIPFLAAGCVLYILIY